MEIPHDKDYGLKYLQSHEWCFWTFDAAPIAVVCFVFAIWHPGRYLPRTYTGFALDKGRAMKEKDEISSMNGGAQQEGELREFKPEDFQSGAPHQQGQVREFRPEDFQHGANTSRV